MKKILLFTLSLMLVSHLWAQIYSEQDKEGLRRILRQEGTDSDENGGLIPSNVNFKKYGLTETDTASWYVNEDWVDKVTMATWNNDATKKVTKLSGILAVEDTYFDLGYFTELDSLMCAIRKFGIYTKFADIDVSQNPKLKYISAMRVRFTENSFSNIKPVLEEISVADISNLKLDKLPALKSYSADNPSFGSQKCDFSNNPLLESIQISGHINFTSIDLSQNINLKELSITTSYSNMLTTVDLSKNKELEKLTLSTLVSLRSLNLSNNTKLKEIILGYLLELEYLTLGDINAKTFYLTESKVSKLDLSKMTNLKELNVEQNLLTELIIPNSISLTNLNCRDNLLKLSALPLNNASQYTYLPQGNINGGVVRVANGIDLSSENIIDGQTTAFSWFEGSSPISLTGTNGKFDLDVSHIGKTLTCQMTNGRFPGLTIKYTVTVSSGIYGDEDKEGLRQMLRQKGDHYTDNGTPYKAVGFELYGLTESDTLTWYQSEEWVEKLSSSLEWRTFGDSNSKHLIKIHKIKAVENALLDMSYFKYLGYIDCSVHKYGIFAKHVTVDISKNLALMSVKGSRVKFTDDSFSVANSEISEIDLVESTYPSTIFDNMPFLQHVFLMDKTPDSFDFSKNTRLETLSITNFGTNLTALNLTKNTALKELRLTTNGDGNIKNLDLSENTNLETLTVLTLVKLKSIDLSKNTKLRKAYFSHVFSLEDISFGNINLDTLTIDKGNLSSIDVSKMTNLTYLNLESNSLTTIDLSNNSNLKYFNCRSNMFQLADLPVLNIDEYIYQPQRMVTIEPVYTSDEIDLSDQYMINGQVSTFKWFENGNPITMVDLGDGKFKYPTGEQRSALSDTEKYLTCEITNPSFPNLALNYSITVKPLNAVGPSGIDSNDAQGNAVTIESSAIKASTPIVILNSSENDGVAQLVNLSGQLISNEKIIGERPTIDAPQQPGLYILIISMNSGEKYSFKLIVTE